MKTVTRAIVLVGVFGVLLYGAYALNRIVVSYKKLQQLNQEIQQDLTEKATSLDRLTSKEKFYEDIVVSQQNEIKAKADAKKAHVDFIQGELKCLADNVYREAAYEPADGQLAVATVIMNRVADPGYPKTVCGVTYERHVSAKNGKIVCQFSWTCKPRIEIHPSVYRSIMEMVRAVYFKHVRSDEAATATLYHADYIQAPDWATDGNKLAQIGHHIFYGN
jgi:spore germination cell wall hydrolase CwlJ-like protein